jgi:ketosteroid isomerase-like protein
VTSPNVELVRAIYSSWELGDFTLVDWADPDIEFVLADGPNPGTWRGLAAMSRAWGSTLAAFDDLRASAEECRDLDEERVLVLTQNSGRGRVSGLELAATGTRGANVFHVRNGRVTRLVAYFSRDRALEELDLL